MAIEGPLRELGIHDVFQLLDLSRKTGVLNIASKLRHNQGMVYFDSGAVVYAAIRSNPHPLGGILVRAGLHCSPNSHRTLGTFPEGTVRVSPGPFNTHREISGFLAALRKIASARR